MSTTINLSATTRASLLASESADAIIFLITITHADLTKPARVCTVGLQRVVETDDELLHGVVSRGETYIYIPNIGITLPTDDDESAPGIGLTIGRFDDVVHAIRSIGVDAPKVNVEMVMSTSPDLVEASWPEFDLQKTSIEADVITGTLGLDSLDTEPGCPYGFTPEYFSGLY